MFKYAIISAFFIFNLIYCEKDKKNNNPIKKNNTFPHTLHTHDEFGKSLEESPYYHVIGPYKKANLSIFFIYGKEKPKSNANDVFLHEIYLKKLDPNSFSRNLSEDQINIKMKIIERFDTSVEDTKNIIGCSFVINGAIQNIFIFYNDNNMKLHFSSLLDHYAQLAAIHFVKDRKLPKPTIADLRKLMKKHKIYGHSNFG